MTSGINLSVLQMDANMPIPSQAQSFTYTTAISQIQFINNFTATSLAPSQNCLEIINYNNAGYRLRQYNNTSTSEGNLYLEYFTDGTLPGTLNAVIDHTHNNTAFGDSSLQNIIWGVDNARNTSFGSFCMPSFETGSDNTVMGWGAAYNLTSGDGNCIFGSGAGYSLTSTEGPNCFVGTNAFQLLTTSSTNCGMGFNVGSQMTSGSGNAFFGNGSAYDQIEYNNCFFFGETADASVNGLTNAGAFGYGAIVGASNSIVLGNGCNVGIGTSTPAYPLDVVGTIRCTDIIVTSESTTPSISNVHLETGAGSGASYTLNQATGNLIGGQFILTVGTAPSFGYLVTFTLSGALSTSTYPVIFTPAGPSTAPALHAETLGISSQAQSTTQFTLSTSVALVSGSTYIWNYFVAN
jgi:hypothetical protein